MQSQFCWFVQPVGEHWYHRDSWPKYTQTISQRSLEIFFTNSSTCLTGSRPRQEKKVRKTLVKAFLALPRLASPAESIWIWVGDDATLMAPVGQPPLAMHEKAAATVLSEASETIPRLQQVTARRVSPRRQIFIIGYFYIMADPFNLLIKRTGRINLFKVGSFCLDLSIAQDGRRYGW